MNNHYLDLEYDFLDNRFDSPMWVGSCFNDARFALAFRKAGFSAFVTKSISQLSDGNPPLRHVKVMHNGDIISTAVSASEYISFNEGGKLIREIKSKSDIKVIANIAPNGTELNTDDLELICKSYPDLIELNLKPLSDSNLYGENLTIPLEDRLKTTVGLANSLISKVASHISVPLIVKTTLELADPSFVVRFQKNGAAAITLSNSMNVIEPLLHTDEFNFASQHFPALSGRSLRNITFRNVATNFIHTKTPIVASGGISSAKDLFYVIGLGAMTAELVTILFKRKPKHLSNLKTELSKILSSNGFSSITELRGSLTKFVLTQKKIKPHTFQINQSCCNQCGMCAFLCPYDAVKKNDKNYFILPKECVGCGLCVIGCDTNAIKEDTQPSQ